MKKITSNTFGKGLNMDLNPLSTPKDVLTDCLNGTVVTYNGDEFSLQTDMGNSRATVIGEGTSDIPDGFIPLGMKEFNNILYIVAHNPITRESRVGSFPAPQRYLPLRNGLQDNLITKTIGEGDGTDRNDVSIWELTKNLTRPGQINHGMNSLTTFLKKGDSYKVALSLKGITDPFTADDILKKFINNYNPESIGAQGYFDLKYFAFNSDGILSELPINITPSLDSKISDIQYSPNPYGNTPAINGVDKVMDKDGPNVIVAAFIPKSIARFDFKLQSYNNAGVLRARVVFVDSSIDDTNSAIKLTSIKITTKNTKPSGEISEESTGYYNYKLHGTSKMAIIENKDGSAFEEGTLISTTCTPIDQFGRELTDRVVTRKYEVTSVLLGTQAHDLFRYKIVGNTLSLEYNFLNDMPGITTTSIEFFDFWSGVSILTAPIAFTSGREVSITGLPLNDIPVTTTFIPGVQYGGILNNSLRSPLSSERILGNYVTNSGLRKNHCYLVRIFGLDNNIEYSVFQLLYTLPIPIFVDNYLIRNFGTIDISEGLQGLSLVAATTGELFGTTPVEKLITAPIIDAATSNYAEEVGQILSQAYRLYGGPVFEEEDNGTIATWNTKNSFYRNVYTKGFSILGPNIEKIGYHEFPESAVGTLLTGVDPLGTNLPVTLFTNGSKNYLRGGLTAKATSSQKDFKFKLASHIKGTSALIEGTLLIKPVYKNITTSLEEPLLFGNIDMGNLTKKITLGSYQGNLNVNIPITSANITETLNWNTGQAPESNLREYSAKVKANLSTNNNQDLITLADFEIQTKRYTYGDSSFKYYIRNFSRNKLFRYFAIKHTQTMKVRVVLDLDYTDLTKHTDYLFSGSMDNSNPGITITASGGVSKYKLVTSPPFDATLAWWDNSEGVTIMDAITNMGVETLIPLGASVVSNLSAVYVKNGSGILKFVSFTSNSNSVEQYIYKTFKSSKPSHIKLTIEDASSALYTNNNLWRWNGLDDYYIAVNTTTSEDYLSNLILYQNYQEVILAQYPKNNIIYNTNTTTTASLTTNKLEYFINTTQTERDKNLTKSCFGTSSLEPFNISKFALIISDWKEKQGAAVKNIYDFTDINLSEGDAKNIPWTFFRGTPLSTVALPNISVSTTIGTPAEHITWFTNAENSLNNSTFLTSSIQTTPMIKAIINGEARPIKTNFVTTELVDASENLNKSNISIPILNKSALLTKIQPISYSYEIKYKLIAPPTVKEIYGGLDVNLGDTYGGGIVFKVYKDSNGTVTGGLIAADSRYTPKYDFYMSRVPSPNLPWAIGSRDFNDGWANTLIMSANPNTKELAVKRCTEHRGGDWADWYLPSVNELVILKEYSLTAPTPILIKDYIYWSSTEEHFDNGEEWAYVVKVAPGNALMSRIERSAQSVHPIRKF